MVADSQQLVIVHIGGEAAGLPIASIQEIILVPQVTVVPGAAGSIRGVVNLRGKVIPVLGLRQLFGMDEVEMTKSSRIVVVQHESETVGLLVDAVSEVVWVQRDAIEELERGSKGHSDLITGVAKLDRLVLIPDVNLIVGSSNARALGAAAA
jgi:chemotaxis signal transduction protein